jgi:peptidoglycan/xylan/chitin deacetylase (PgdA/CDA1 family)
MVSKRTVPGPVDEGRASTDFAKHLSRVVKLLLSFGFWGVSEAVRFLLRLARFNSAGIATIIYYHQVQPHERERFARQLDHLRKWTHLISADREEPLPKNTHCVAVTFDDGWRSFAEIAFPELAQRQIPVTLFAVAGRLGQRLEQYSEEPLISEQQLQWLADKGVTIGSHSLTHCALTRVDEERALYELRESRRLLSNLLEQDVVLFAFPLSQSNERLIQLCREAGYRRVFTGLPYVAYSRLSAFAAGRVRVDPSDWLPEFHLKIMGAYRWLPAAFALKSGLRSIARRLLNRAHQAVVRVMLGSKFHVYR